VVEGKTVGANSLEAHKKKKGKKKRRLYLFRNQGGEEETLSPPSIGGGRKHTKKGRKPSVFPAWVGKKKTQRFVSGKEGPPQVLFPAEKERTAARKKKEERRGQARAFIEREKKKKAMLAGCSCSLGGGRKTTTEEGNRREKEKQKPAKGENIWQESANGNEALSLGRSLEVAREGERNNAAKKGRRGPEKPSPLETVPFFPTKKRKSNTMKKRGDDRFEMISESLRQGGGSNPGSRGGGRRSVMTGKKKKGKKKTQALPRTEGEETLTSTETSKAKPRQDRPSVYRGESPM